MNGAELWKGILAVAAGSGVLIGILAFVVRSLFLHFLSHDLEAHKAKLTGENALALERFKAELSAAAFAREKLHEKRLQVIAELYERLATADAAFRGFLAPLQLGGKEEHRKQVIEALGKVSDFLNYFDGKRIYFDACLCSLLDAMEEPFRRAVAEFAPYFLTSAPDIAASGVQWEKARQEFMGKVPKLRAEIETRAREMLGVLGPGRVART